MRPTWLTAFVDLTTSTYDAGVAFWAAVTGTSVSPSRGDHDEFATLVPADGDAYLRVQRVGEPGGVHVDVHRPGQPFEVRRSPGGLAYCEVSERLERRPSPPTWPGGHRSVVDQVCLDIPSAVYDEECAFWHDLTGWELRGPTGEHGEFRRLVRPEVLPLHLLLQRVGDDRPRVTAHLDLATDDRAAETERHERLGATVLRRHQHFSVLADPTGTAYCITDRSPVTGMLS